MFRKAYIYRLKDIASNDGMVAFYTGFPSYFALHSCFKFFGPAVDFLHYSGGIGNEPTSEKRFHLHDLSRNSLLSWFVYI